MIKISTITPNTLLQLVNHKMIGVDRNLDPKAKEKHKNVVELIQCNFKWEPY